ncbi:MAG: hypothetical protein GXY38_05325 [Planctomycetes bacterium]|nr:hypothetical protein [Planctomycetota bacterium]
METHRETLPAKTPAQPVAYAIYSTVLVTRGTMVALGSLATQRCNPAAMSGRKTTCSLHREDDFNG